MRTYRISICNGRLILSASSGTLYLFQADFSISELDALLGMLRNELVNETARLVEEVSAEVGEEMPA